MSALLLWAWVRLLALARAARCGWRLRRYRVHANGAGLTTACNCIWYWNGVDVVTKVRGLVTCPTCLEQLAFDDDMRASDVVDGAETSAAVLGGRR